MTAGRGPQWLALMLEEEATSHNAGDLEELGRAHRQVLPWKLQKELSPASTEFWETHVRLPTPRAIREYICTALSHQIWGYLL